MLKLKMNVIFVESATDPVILKGMAPSQKITMQAVTAEGAGENAAWSKWTPFGQLQFTVTNPDAFDKVSAGDVVYVTLDKVATATTVTAGGMAGL